MRSRRLRSHTPHADWRLAGRGSGLCRCPPPAHSLAPQPPTVPSVPPGPGPSTPPPPTTTSLGGAPSYVQPLSGGAIAGIVVGVLAFLAICALVCLGCGCFAFSRYARRRGLPGVGERLGDVRDRLRRDPAPRRRGFGTLRSEPPSSVVALSHVTASEHGSREHLMRGGLPPASHHSLSTERSLHGTPAPSYHSRPPARS